MDEPGGHALGEMSQTQKDKQCVVSTYTWNPEEKRLSDSSAAGERDSGCQGLEVGETQVGGKKAHTFILDE